MWEFTRQGSSKKRWVIKVSVWFRAEGKRPCCMGYSSFSLPEDGVVYFTGIAGRGGVSWPSNSIKSATNNQGPQWIHYNYLYDPLTFSVAPPAGQSFPLIQRNMSTSLSVLSDLLIFPLVPTWCRHFWFWLNWLGLPLNVTQIFIDHWGW